MEGIVYLQRKKLPLNLIGTIYNRYNRYMDYYDYDYDYYLFGMCIIYIHDTAFGLDLIVAVILAIVNGWLLRVVVVEGQ